MIRTLTIAAAVLFLASPAFSQDDRERDLNRLEEIRQLRKIGERGKAAVVAARTELVGQGEDIADATGAVGEIKADVTHWKQVSEFNPLPWILGGLGIVAPAVATPIVLARRAAKRAAELAAQTMNAFAGDPAHDAGQPFPGAAPHSYAPGSTGSGTIRGPRSGGSGSGHAGEPPAVKPPPALPAPTESGTYEIPPGVRVRMGSTSTNGGGGH